MVKTYNVAKAAEEEIKAAEKAVKVAKEKAKEALKAHENAKLQLAMISRKNHIEEIFLRFPHLGQQILKKLGNQNLIKFKSTSRLLEKITNEDKTIWIREIQEYLSIPQLSVTRLLQKAQMEFLRNCAKILRLISYGSRDKTRPKPSTNIMLFRILRQQKVARIFNENNLFLIKLIVNEMENKNPTIFTGTLLHEAAIYGNFEVCKFIIEQIEDTNPWDQFNKNTPLHEAARKGHFTVCTLFVKYTRNLNPRNNKGKTPFDLAKENGHDKICKLIKSVNIKQNDTSRNPKRRKIT